MTQKETDRETCTHSLETVEGTCQDTERNRPSDAYSLSGDGGWWGLSGYEKKPTERGALTSWRGQRERPVRTQKETDQARRTHDLGTTEGRAC